MTVKPGSESSEHAKALRAEVVGLVLLAVGVLAALCLREVWRAVMGMGVAGIGGAIFASANSAYAATRGAVKAAAVRRPADSAPRAL